MRISDYTQYFENISELYTEITGFFEASLFDEDALKEKLRGGQAKPLALVIEPYSRRSLQTQTGNEIDGLSCAYTVLDKLNKKDAGRFSALAKAEAAVLEIRSRMILDYNEQCKILDGLNTGSFRADAVGMIANEWAGWRMEFFVSVEERPLLSDAHWPQYTPFKSLK